MATKTDTSGVVAKGIDVSKYQGDIDWEKVHASGDVEFAILRAGYGKESNQIDPTFACNYAACQKWGIPCGAYWYSYAATSNEAAQEAAICLHTLSGKQFAYPIAYDIEEKSSLSHANEIAKSFCSKLEESGYYAMIYANKSNLETYFQDSITTRYDTWLANVGVEKSAYSRSYGIWQYSWKGSIDGISGDVDLDYAYQDYSSIIQKAGLNGFGTDNNATDFSSYTVKVTTSALHIRRGPGTDYAIVGTIQDKGVYTIVAESAGTGASLWGKLKSGAGWISLDYTIKLGNTR